MKYPEDFIDKIICGDCIEVMRQIPDNSINLAIVDPPYGIDYQSAWRIESKRFDKIVGDKNINTLFIRDVYRILIDNGALYCFTRWDVYPQWYNEISKYFVVKSVIIWDRVIHGLGDLNGSYAPTYDMIIFAVKGKHKLRGNRPKDILRYKRVDANKLLHPNQKPIELISELIRKSSDEGDIILDTMCGSGTMCVAAKKLKRHYIGIDISQKYCDIAKERLSLVEVYNDIKDYF